MPPTCLKFSYIDANHDPDEKPIHQPICYITSSDDCVRFQKYLADTISSIASSIEKCDLVLSNIKQFEESGEFLLVLKSDDAEFIIDRAGVVQVIKSVAGKWVNKPDGRFLLRSVIKTLKARRHFLEMPASLETSHVVEL